MRRTWGKSAVAGVLACPILATATATAADAIDLTGEWRGTTVCDELGNGRPSVFADTSPVFIRQRAGGRFTMLLRLSGGEADVIYEGLVQRVAGGGHEVIAVACGGDFRSREVVRLRPILAGDREGLFNGESQLFSDDFPGTNGAVNFGTCKYAYQRATTVRPTIERCVPSPIGGP
jgi:hypothetical protein